MYTNIKCKKLGYQCGLRRVGVIDQFHNGIIPTAINCNSNYLINHTPLAVTQEFQSSPSGTGYFIHAVSDFSTKCVQRNAHCHTILLMMLCVLTVAANCSDVITAGVEVIAGDITIAA